jgi:hypothetical protein
MNRAGKKEMWEKGNISTFPSLVHFELNYKQLDLSFNR